MNAIHPHRTVALLLGLLGLLGFLPSAITISQAQTATSQGPTALHTGLIAEVSQ